MNSTPNSRKRLSRVSRIITVILLAIVPLLITETGALADPASFLGTHLGLTAAINGFSMGTTNMYSGIAGTSCDTNTNGASPDVITGAFYCPSPNYYIFDGINVPSAYNGFQFAQVDACAGTIRTTAGWPGSTLTTGNMSLSDVNTCRLPTPAQPTGIELDVKTGSTCFVALAYGTMPGGFGVTNSCSYTPPTSYCTTASFVNPAGSYVGTTLSVRFTWQLSFPSGFPGWSVAAPDPGSNTSSIGTMTPTKNSVDGAQQVYYGTFTVSADTAMTARVWVPDWSTYTGCYVSLTLTGNQISQTPTDTTTGADGDTSTSTNPNCGFSLNPFHYLKCLFEPSSSLQQWSDLKNTAQTHPPISLIVSADSYVSGVYGALWGGSDPDLTYSTSGADGRNICARSGISCPLGADNGTFTDPTGQLTSSHELDIIGAAGNWVHSTTWGQGTYMILQVSIYIGAFFVIWNMVSASFGGKGSSDGL